ncbi:hypothetical protein PSTG_15276 [Puccinia striiformis f. sp. tritici PST-78]|uniref:Uncharacterized protein n=3 Tax=Puccinia striiformis f. sp. tritici TaxID=168172 RepID=A0A0L0UW61_9BASI|nr:hypothetical protein PSTG_15276 [Puccinia striiformis f. sp. tritici PST-78]
MRSSHPPSTIFTFFYVLAIYHSHLCRHLTKRASFLAAQDTKAIAASSGEPVAVVPVSKEIISHGEDLPVDSPGLTSSLRQRVGKDRLPPINQHPEYPDPSLVDRVPTPSEPDESRLERETTVKTRKGRLSSLKKYLEISNSNSPESQIPEGPWLRSCEDWLVNLFSKISKKNGTQPAERGSVGNLAPNGYTRRLLTSFSNHCGNRRFADLKGSHESAPDNWSRFFSMVKCSSRLILLAGHSLRNTASRSKEAIARVMAMNRKRKGNGRDPQEVAKIIGERLSPPGDPSNAEYQEELERFVSFHRTYLENIQDRQKAINTLKTLQNEWIDIKTLMTLHTLHITKPLSHLNNKVSQEIVSALESLDHQEFRSKFTAEFRGIVKGIESTARFKEKKKPEAPSTGLETRKQKAARLQKEREAQAEREKKWELVHTDMRRYFPDAVLKEENDLLYGSFAEARAFQMTRQPAQETHITISSNTMVEDIVRTLPKDLDLVEEIYRFIMLKGLGNIFRAIRPQVVNFVKITVEDRLADIFPRIIDHETHFGSLLRSDKEEDILWRESLFSRFSPIGMSPSEVYEKLKQAPDVQTQIRHALKNPPEPATFLSMEDWLALKEASSTRRTFKSQLSEIENRMQDAIENLKKETLGKNLPNHPFIEELFEKGVIDHLTRKKLNEAGKVSKEELINKLGSEQEFKSLLMKKHDEDLLKLLVTPESQSMIAVRKAVKSLTKFYLAELDRKAKSIYLTRDAFLKPNSFRAVEGWMVYDQEAIKELIRSPADSKMVIKTYAEAHLSKPTEETTNSVEEEQSAMEQFLSEIKIPQSPKESVLASEFPKFDERLFALAQRPLERRDERLAGTSFENLSLDLRLKLNDAAQEFYLKRDTLEAKVHKIQILGEKIQVTEKNELAHEIPQLTRLFNSISWPVIDLD